VSRRQHDLVGAPSLLQSELSDFRRAVILTTFAVTMTA